MVLVGFSPSLIILPPLPPPPFSLLSFVKALAEMNFNEEERKEGCRWDASLSLFPFLNQPTNRSRTVTPLPFKKAPMGGRKRKSSYKKILTLPPSLDGKRRVVPTLIGRAALASFFVFWLQDFVFSQCGSFFMPKSVLFHSTFSPKKRAVLQIFRARDQKRDVYHRGLEGNKKRATAIITPPTQKNTRILCAQKLKRVRGVVAVVAKFLRITLHRVQKLFCVQKRNKKRGETIMNLQKTRRRWFIPLSHAKWKTAAVGFPDTKKKRRKKETSYLLVFGRNISGEIESRAHYNKRNPKSKSTRNCQIGKSEVVCAEIGKLEEEGGRD